MTAADLTEWIALFQMELTPDSAGGSIETVPDDLVPDRPANVRQAAGPVVVSSDQLADRVRYEITIRYEPWINSAWRVLWRDRHLDMIQAPENVGMRSEWLKLTCERKEAGVQ